MAPNSSAEVDALVLSLLPACPEDEVVAGNGKQNSEQPGERVSPPRGQMLVCYPWIAYFAKWVLGQYRGYAGQEELTRGARWIAHLSLETSPSAGWPTDRAWQNSGTT